MEQSLLELVAKPGLQLARVEAVTGVEVAVAVGPGAAGRRCRVLQTSAAPPLRLEPGDVVLTWWPEEESSHGVILGRVAGGHPAADGGDAPDELLLEAKERVRLKCGEATVELRASGKVLVRGDDIVSRASRSNRIKGGSVEIN